MAAGEVSATASIELKDSLVFVRDIEIRSKDVAQYLEAVPADEREEALINALEVGIFCLGRAGGARDLDFVRREIDQLLSSVSETVDAIPAKTTEELKGRLGSDDGGILKPFSEVVGDARSETLAKLDQVRKLLEEEIDPRRSDSTLAKALAEIRTLLDADRNDSIQGRFDGAIRSVSAPDGALSRSVRVVVEEAVKPVIEQFSLLQKTIGGEEGKAEVVELTTLKGGLFEDKVFEAACELTKPLGAQVEHVGGDNQPGDVTIELDADGATGMSLRIVVEAKDDQAGRGDVRIKDDVGKAMGERSATCGLLIARTPEALGKKFGDWYDGKIDAGYFVATTLDYLPVALRFLINRERIDALRAGGGEVDVARLHDGFDQVRTTLKRCTEVKKSARKIRNEADRVDGLASSISSDISDVLDDLEGAIRRAELPEDA